MDIFLFLMMVGGGIFFFWYVDYKICQAEDKENAKFIEATKHFSVEQQCELWLAKMRYDAERDLF